jgi:hypothetical protein
VYKRHALEQTNREEMGKKALFALTERVHFPQFMAILNNLSRDNDDPPWHRQTNWLSSSLTLINSKSFITK